MAVTRSSPSPGRSARFTLPIDERLRAVALGHTSRLAQYEIEVESPLRPKEIQARIRAGETVEEIADAAGIAVERVRWFEGPVLAERAYIADQAQKASVRRHGDSTPGPRLGEIVAERMNAIGADPDEAQWDAKKRGDGSWQVQLTFTSGGRLHVAEWVFDPRRRHVLPADDNAARMSLPGAEPPQPTAPPPGEATVTRLAPRLGNARHERTGARRVRRSTEPVPPPSAPSAHCAARPACAPGAGDGRAEERRVPPGRRGAELLAAAPAPGARVPAPLVARRAGARTSRPAAGRPAERPVAPGDGDCPGQAVAPPNEQNARAARRLAAGVPRSRPGTRSCSAAPASETDGEPLFPGTHAPPGPLAGHAQRLKAGDSLLCAF